MRLARTGGARPTVRSAGTVHLLHVSKTGGTALKSALRNRELDGKYRLVPHRHETSIADVPGDELVAFVLRDPIDRFPSAFYSRKRQGAPAYSVPHTREEAAAYARFPTPQSLAEALEGTDRDEAIVAMNAVLHLRSHYSDWLGTPEELRSASSRILFIGFQESLDDDVARLSRMLGFHPPITLPTDEAARHVAPAGEDRRLDATAIANLERWYAEDRALYELARTLPAATRAISSQ